MPDPLVCARFDRQSGGAGKLVLSHQLAAPAERVWQALTMPAEIAAWMDADWLGAPDQLDEGMRFDARLHGSGLDTKGVVTLFEPLEALEHVWSPYAFPPSVARWALTARGSDCRLTLTHRLPAPDDIPRTATDWALMIGALSARVEGRPVPVVDWRALRDRYAVLFGEAATRDGRAIIQHGLPSLRYDRIVAHPPEDLWDVLVSREGLALWMGAAESSVDPWLGGRFNLVLPGGSSMDGTITRWEPARALTYDWTDAGGAPASLRVELAPHAEGTRVTLIRSPDGGPSRPVRAFGWHFHADALELAMQGKAAVFAPERAAALQMMYALTLG